MAGKKLVVFELNWKARVACLILSPMFFRHGLRSFSSHFLGVNTISISESQRLLDRSGTREFDVREWHRFCARNGLFQWRFKSLTPPFLLGFNFQPYVSSLLEGELVHGFHRFMFLLKTIETIIGIQGTKGYQPNHRCFRFTQRETSGNLLPSFIENSHRKFVSVSIKDSWIFP